MLDLNAGKILNWVRTFRIVNESCAKTSESVVPFSDREYYATQAANLWDITERDAELIAMILDNFARFKASCVEVDDLSKASDQWEDDPRPGRVYMEALTIASIDHPEGKWELIIGNWDQLSNDLEDLEVDLFEWSISAGYFDEILEFINKNKEVKGCTAERKEIEMNALLSFNEAVTKGAERYVRIADLALAWLQLHRDKPGLHPDDYLDIEGPYCGWIVLLARQFMLGFPHIKDDATMDALRFPGFLCQLEQYSLPQLSGFHGDLEEEEELAEGCQKILDFLQNMTMDRLEEVIAILDELIAYHADGPKDVLCHVEIAYKVFAYIQSIR